MFVSPILTVKSLKNISLKGCQIISLSMALNYWSAQGVHLSWAGSECTYVDGNIVLAVERIILNICTLNNCSD